MKLCVPIVLMAVWAHAQTTASRVIPQSFEVVSIKRNETGSERHVGSTSPGGLYTATNLSLKQLISRAYGIAQAQIEGGPGWIDTDAFDIQAKADTALHLTRDEVRPCLRAMLADRFQLAVHRETKQGAVYSLTVAKNGPKFKEHTGPGQPGIGVSTDSGKATIIGTNITMAALAEYLSGQAGRPVLNNTGLAGAYDIRVEWATDQTANPSEASIFTAIQEQLGLKIAATRGPIETIIVDRVERPSEN
jgi:uncharacterized protein (TIGR03435 family)